MTTYFEGKLGTGRDDLRGQFKLSNGLIHFDTRHKYQPGALHGMNRARRDEAQQVIGNLRQCEFIHRMNRPTGAFVELK